MRVSLFGDSKETADWSAFFSERAVEVTRAESLDALLEGDPGLAFIFAQPDEAASIVARLLEKPRVPPVTMLLGPPGEAHPHTRLVHALTGGKRQWEKTFDAMVDCVAVLGPDGTVMRANLALAGAVSREIGKTVSVPYGELLGVPEPGYVDPIAESLVDGRARTREVRYSKLPGIRQVTTSALADSGDASLGLVAVLKDVSEIREQQERLLQAARLADIGQLAAGVAHEINTPLASIALRAESLLRSARDPRLGAIESFKNFPRHLTTIDEEIFRCKKIISALLDFSRSRKPEIRETDLNGLAERAADLVGHQMKLKQVQLALQLDRELPRLQADDGQLRQALIALLMNALDATAAGGRVSVETRREAGGFVSLSVNDSGVGIPPEHLDKIFSPFFTTKPPGQGTGLGLAICHGVVASHGGEIRIDSAPGRGTRIALLLPLTGPGSSPPARGAP